MFIVMYLCLFGRSCSGLLIMRQLLPVWRCLFVVNGYMKNNLALRTKGGRVVLIELSLAWFLLVYYEVFSGSLLLYVLLLLVFSNTEEVF